MQKDQKNQNHGKPGSSSAPSHYLMLKSSDLEGIFLEGNAHPGRSEFVLQIDQKQTVILVTIPS